MTSSGREAVWLVAAGLMGASGVAAGAWAAHGLADEPTAREWAVTASNYQMLHAAALLGVVALGRSVADSRGTGSHAGGRLAGGALVEAALVAARWLLVVGTLLFSGTLHMLAMGYSAPFSGSAPLGGTALILAWSALCVAGVAAAFRRPS